LKKGEKMKAAFRTAVQTDAGHILKHMKRFYAEDGYNSKTGKPLVRPVGLEKV
jgi:hypothetical protein